MASLALCSLGRKCFFGPFDKDLEVQWCLSNTSRSLRKLRSTKVAWRMETRRSSLGSFQPIDLETIWLRVDLHQEKRYRELPGVGRKCYMVDWSGSRWVTTHAVQDRCLNL